MRRKRRGELERSICRNVCFSVEMIFRFQLPLGLTIPDERCCTTCDTKCRVSIMEHVTRFLFIVYNDVIDQLELNNFSAGGRLTRDFSHLLHHATVTC